MGGTEPTPVADESAAVAANMAGDSVPDDSMLEGDLAGEPGTMSERTADRGRDAPDDAPDDATDDTTDDDA